MDDKPLPVFSSRHVGELIAAAPGQFAVFLGAGASCSSGVASAGAMVDEWRAKAHRYADTPLSQDDWCQQQDWFKKPHEYSALFEAMHPNAQARQTYIESKIDGALPGWGYLYLANLIANGWFNVVLTTNIDDLLSKALSIYTDYVPVVCAADSEVLSISLTARRAKIIKLHGDYLFRRLKNTIEELKKLDPNMQTKFDQVAQNMGLLVLGYGGRDHSVMSLLESALKRADNFGPGIYWGLWRNEPVPPLVDALSRAHGDRFHLFRYHEFDAFVAGLHSSCRVQLPLAVLEPYDALRAKLKNLVHGDAANSPAQDAAAAPASDAAGIPADRAMLQERLDRPGAQPDSADLLHAQLALARREPAAALRHVSAYVQRHPRDSQALTAWAGALVQQAEDGAVPADPREAIAKLEEALRIDAANVAARYGLLTVYVRAEMDPEAIATAQALLERVPKDKYLRAMLAQLYLKKGRVAEANAAARECLRLYPEDANVHQLWSSLMIRGGNTTESLKAIERAIEINPRNPAFHAQRGNILMQSMRMKDAVSAFEEALRLDPEDHFTRLFLARCHMMHGAADAAIGQARQALRSNADSVEAIGLLGELYLQSNDLNAALEQFDRLVLLTPDDARAWSSRGQALLQAGRVQDAERDMRKAVNLRPGEPNFLGRLAWLYRMTNQGRKLQATLDDMRRVDPQAAQMLEAQLRGGAPAMLPNAGAGGVVQRVIDAFR